VTGSDFLGQERRRALLGVIAYLPAAVLARWQSFVSLLVLCLLPVFYGAIREGWSATLNRCREG
jgi:hypothetical protein